MNVILSYYKCMDDWQDERKPLRYAYATLLKNTGKKHMASYPEKIRKIQDALFKLSRLEKQGETDVDRVAGCSGRIMEEVLAFRKDMWELHFGEWDFIWENSFTSWMPTMTWKKTRKTEITIHFLRNIRWKGSKKRYAGC